MTTTDQYKQALEKLELSATQAAMLKAHYQAPDRRITMTRLAEVVGYKSYSAGNLQYGRLAKILCKAIGAEPDEKNKDGQPFWLAAIAEAWKNNDGEYEFQMWPELAEALEEQNLVEPRGRADEY